MIDVHLAGEVLWDGVNWPCLVHTIDLSAAGSVRAGATDARPDFPPSAVGGLVLVDTGMIDSTPELDEQWHPTLHPLPPELVARVAHVVITHMHFDHIGGNRLFPGIPIHVQRVELVDARAEEDYTVREWIDFPGMNYVEHDGEAEILPGVRLVPASGETRGHQIVVVDTPDGKVVIGGDVGHSFKEIGQADTPGKRYVIELGAPVYLAHQWEPKVPRTATPG